VAVFGWPLGEVVAGEFGLRCCLQSGAGTSWSFVDIHIDLVFRNILATSSSIEPGYRSYIMLQEVSAAVLSRKINSSYQDIV